MQSGISASQDLLNAFNELVSSPTQRGLLASIENESLVPVNVLPLTSSFEADLNELQGFLAPHKAHYILLKLAPGEPDGFAAITFVPNAAPVRQKMLFASTRLTLVRELGIERFRETLFATEKAELTAEGWAKHEKHTQLEAPLTEEEAGQAALREAEVQESGGTGARRGHVKSKADALKREEGLEEVLAELGREEGLLIQLKFDLPDETLRLASRNPSISPSALSSTLSQSDPRLSFYAYPASSAANPSSPSSIIFIYTCPTSSKIKDRMMYSTSKTFTRYFAEQNAGLVIAKSLEASDPSEILEAELAQEFGASGSGETGDGAGEKKSGFARPKRPGRR